MSMLSSIQNTTRMVLTMDGKKHLSGTQKRKRKTTREKDVKRIKVSLTNIRINKILEIIVVTDRDRQHANCYGLSVDTSSETD